MNKTFRYLSVLLTVIVANTFIFTGNQLKAEIKKEEFPANVHRKVTYNSSKDLQSILDSIQDNSTVYIDWTDFSSEESFNLTRKNNVTIVFPEQTYIHCLSPTENVFNIIDCNGVQIFNGIFRHFLKEPTTCMGDVFYINRSNKVDLIKADINGCGSIGIVANECTNIRTLNCYIHHNSVSAFQFYKCAGTLMLGDRIEDNGDSGVQLFSPWGGQNLTEVEIRCLLPAEATLLDTYVSIHNTTLSTRIVLRKSLKDAYQRYLLSHYLQNVFMPNMVTLNKLGIPTISIHRDIYEGIGEIGDEWIKNASNTFYRTQPLNDPNIIYSVNDDQSIVKSVDRGENWRQIENGLSERQQYRGIIANPYQESEVFLLGSEGLYRTSDAGFTWVLLKTSDQLLQFIIDPVDVKTYYMLTKSELFKSIDSGQTWINIAVKLPRFDTTNSRGVTESKGPTLLSVVKINQVGTHFLLVGSEKGLFRSDNEGESWALVSNVCMWCCYRNDNKLFVGGALNGSPALCRSDLSGQKWDTMDIEHPVHASYIQGLYQNKSKLGVFLYYNNDQHNEWGTYENDMLAFVDTKLNVVGMNYGPNPHSVVISQVETSDGKQYKIVENNREYDVKNRGIWVSDNQGVSWRECLIYSLFNNSDAYNIQKMYVSPFDSKEVWSFDNEKYFFTQNGGRNWETVNNILNLVSFKSICDFSFDYQDKNLLYFSVGDYNTSELYRFDRTTKGYTSLRVCGVHFAVAKDNSKKIVTGMCELSIDGGWTWTSFQSKLEQALDISLDLSSRDVLVDPYMFEGDIIKVLVVMNETSYRAISTDGGITWKKNQ